MNRFFAYEEYGAKYEMMVHDVAASYKSMPAWRAYEKGIETLAASVTSINNRKAQSHKGLTFGDLLIKPIQRVCKYPLLFADLARQTPVCDCPQAHASLTTVHYRLRETTREINKATDDPHARHRFTQTWLLQDRLVFDDPTRASAAVTVRLLGHAILCGALHVAWQTPSSGVHGDFLLCALFRSYLVLAHPDKHASTFHVVACIGLENMKIEAADNGKGLQCHTAPYTFKVVFESDSRLFELLLSACSETEEAVWRQHVTDRAVARDADDSIPSASGSASGDILSFLSLEIKPIGSIFGQRGTLARRISIHRAITLSPKPGICQVIIKNTHSPVEGQDSPSPGSSSIFRSQSVLSTSRVPILAPRRIERIRLENSLTDVWTKEILPFPGMSTGKGDRPIKVSASSIIRKLSMASFTGSFSRRSPGPAGALNHPASRQPNRNAEGEVVDDENTEGPSDVVATEQAETGEEEIVGRRPPQSEQGQRRHSNTMRSTINRAVSPSKMKLAQGFKRSASVLLPGGEGKRKAGPSAARGAENESIDTERAESEERDEPRRSSNRPGPSDRLGQSRSVSGFVKWFGY
jgi:hypothetical protein